jgi:hypothetical protein
LRAAIDGLLTANDHRYLWLPAASRDAHGHARRRRRLPASTEIRCFAGVVLAVTTMVQPAPPAPIAPLVSAVRAGQVAMGWVRVDVTGF